MSDHSEITKRVNALNIKMLKLRKDLNVKHFYPVMDEIQKDCGKLGHVKGRFVQGIVSEYYTCGFCNAVMEETRTNIYEDQDE